MYSKFFQHSDINTIEQELDKFLKELEEVTGKIINLEIIQRDNEILLLVIYNCWKKI
jgi:hypothetical protein